jgi:hypothetical protein
MTDKITISAATPSAMPMNDAALMNDTTPRRRRDRKYRKPMKNSSGWNIERH